MHSICHIHTFDAYLLLVSVLVYHHQGEELCHLLEKPITVITLLSLGSLLYLIYHENKYTVKGTIVLIFKRIVCVQWLETYNGIIVLPIPCILCDIIHLLRPIKCTDR